MNGWNKNLKDIGCERKLFECYPEFLWDTTNVQYTVLGRKIYNEETGEYDITPQDQWRLGLLLDDVLVYVTECGCVRLDEKFRKRIVRTGHFSFKVVDDVKIRWRLVNGEKYPLLDFINKLECRMYATHRLWSALDNWRWVDLYKRQS